MLTTCTKSAPRPCLLTSNIHTYAAYPLVSGTEQRTTDIESAFRRLHLSLDEQNANRTHSQEKLDASGKAVREQEALVVLIHVADAIHRVKIRSTCSS
ncbi:unnamed protein product [Aphanomyces euteiches]